MNSSQIIAVVCRWVMILALLCGTSATSLLAAVLDQWHWRNPLPQGNALYNLVHANGQYVALSDLGTILTSTNGTNWIRRETGLIDSFDDCSFGNDRFVAVGYFGAIATSLDGVTWVPQFGGTFYSLYGVTYGDGMFVAVGDGATILTSQDGVEWVMRASGPWPLTDVTYSGGVFVAVGRGGVVTSSDGIRWTRRSAPDAGSMRSVSHGGGQFFAVGGDSFEEDGIVWFSPDGILWRSHRISDRNSFRALAYGDGVWLAAGGEEQGYFSEGNGAIYASIDTTNWTQVASNVATITGLAFADPSFVAAGDDGRFLTSSNGISWSDPWQSSLPPVRTRRNMAFVNDSFVAVYGDQFALSSDGTVWTNNYVVPYIESSFGLSTIAYGHGRYVAGGGYYGTLWASTNGVGWSTVSTNLSVGNVLNITFGDGRFVAVAGYQGMVLTSVDGLTWTLQKLQTNNSTTSIHLADVAYGNGVFAAVGDTAASTADGMNWTLSPLEGYFPGIAYGNGVFVAVGDDVIATSSNGVHWATQAINESGQLNDVAFGSGWFVAVGGESDEFEGFNPSRSESPILVSQDGVNWVRRRSFTTQRLSQVAYGRHTFVIATESGGILQSDPLIRLEIEHQATPRLLLSAPLNRSFRIEYTDTLAPPVHWQFLSNIVTTTDPFLSFDSQKPGNDGARYYRAVLQP